MSEHLDLTRGRTSFTVARLGRESSGLLQAHVIGPRLARDKKRLYAFVQVDMAHTVMLAEQGILTPPRAAAILEVLKEIDSLGPDFPVNPRYDSLLLQIEKYLTDRIGEDVAGRMHTGRSRIDQNVSTKRVLARDTLLKVVEQLVALEEALLRLAERHVETLMPGYTHGQHAQPWTFGHYLMRQFYLFERDLQRLEGAFGRTNLSSLGGAALAGTSWDLNRDRTCELLGHDAIIRNAHDCGGFSPDFPEENAAVLSILMNHLGRPSRRPGSRCGWTSGPRAARCRSSSPSTAATTSRRASTSRSATAPARQRPSRWSARRGIPLAGPTPRSSP